jgi:hypothetical protein
VKNRKTASLDKKGKGVICKVEEPENMPVDENGNRADIVMDAASTISRMNLGRLYEQHMASALRDVTQNVRMLFGFERLKPTSIKAENLLDSFPIQKIEEAHQYVLGFYNLISEKQYNFYSKLTDPKQIAEHICDIISDHVYAYIPIDKQISSKDIVKRIENSIYKPVYGKITYRGNSGEVVLTERNVRIAPLYMMLLEKIADDWTAVATGNLQLHGLLAQVNRREKHSRPHRNTPVRTIGETEGRLFVGYCGREAVAEMLDRSGNPLVQRHMTRNILEANRPTNINEIVDRNLVNYGNTKSVQIINHMFTCMGFKTKYVPE